MIAWRRREVFREGKAAGPGGSEAFAWWTGVPWRDDGAKRSTAGGSRSGFQHRMGQLRCVARAMAMGVGQEAVAEMVGDPQDQGQPPGVSGGHPSANQGSVEDPRSQEQPQKVSGGHQRISRRSSRSRQVSGLSGGHPSANQRSYAPWEL